MWNCISVKQLRIPIGCLFFPPHFKAILSGGWMIGLIENSLINTFHMYAHGCSPW